MLSWREFTHRPPLSPPRILTYSGGKGRGIFNRLIGVEIFNRLIDLPALRQVQKMLFPLQRGRGQICDYGFSIDGGQ